MPKAKPKSTVKRKTPVKRKVSKPKTVTKSKPKPRVKKAPVKRRVVAKSKPKPKTVKKAPVKRKVTKVTKTKSTPKVKVLTPKTKSNHISYLLSHNIDPMDLKEQDKYVELSLKASKPIAKKIQSILKSRGVNEDLRNIDQELYEVYEDKSYINHQPSATAIQLMDAKLVSDGGNLLILYHAMHGKPTVASKATWDRVGSMYIGKILDSYLR